MAATTDEYLACPDCDWRIAKDEPMAAAKRGQHRKKEHGVPGRDQAKKAADPADRTPPGRQADPPKADDFATGKQRKTKVAKDMEAQVQAIGRVLFMWDVVCGATLVRSAENIGAAADAFAKEFPWFADGLESSTKATAILGLVVAVGQPLAIMGAHHGLLPAALVPADLTDAEARVRAAEADPPPAPNPGPGVTVSAPPPAPAPAPAPNGHSAGPPATMSANCSPACKEGHTMQLGCVLAA